MIMLNMVASLVMSVVSAVAVSRIYLQSWTRRFFGGVALHIRVLQGISERQVEKVSVNAMSQASRK